MVLLRARCEVLRLTSLFLCVMAGLAPGYSGRIGAVDAFEYDTEGDPGIGVDTGLPFLDADRVDILRSHEDLAVPLPLNSKTEFAWVVEGRELSINASCRQSCS